MISQSAYGPRPNLQAARLVSHTLLLPENPGKFERASCHADVAGFGANSGAAYQHLHEQAPVQRHDTRLRLACTLVANSSFDVRGPRVCLLDTCHYHSQNRQRNCVVKARVRVLVRRNLATGAVGFVPLRLLLVHALANHSLHACTVMMAELGLLSDMHQQRTTSFAAKSAYHDMQLISATFKSLQVAP